MVTIADIVGSLGRCFEAQRALEQCRQRATGDVEYYSYSFAQDLNQAETALEQTLDAYIDQRIAQKIERHNTPATFEQLTPVTRPAAMLA